MSIHEKFSYPPIFIDLFKQIIEHNVFLEALKRSELNHEEIFRSTILSLRKGNSPSEKEAQTTSGENSLYYGFTIDSDLVPSLVDVSLWFIILHFTRKTGISQDDIIYPFTTSSQERTESEEKKFSSSFRLIYYDPKLVIPKPVENDSSKVIVFESHIDNSLVSVLSSIRDNPAYCLEIWDEGSQQWVNIDFQKHNSVIFSGRLSGNPTIHRVYFDPSKLTEELKTKPRIMLFSVTRQIPKTN